MATSLESGSAIVALVNRLWQNDGVNFWSLIMKGHAALPLLMKTHGLGTLSSPVRSLSVKRHHAIRVPRPYTEHLASYPSLQSLNHIRGASLVAQMVTNLPAMQESWVWSLDQEDPLEKGMGIHSSILAWRIPWTEEPDGLQSMALQRVGHNWATNIHKR